MKKRILDQVGRHWPLLFTLALWILSLAWLLSAALASSSGTFVYASDDAYLRLAIARNLVLNRTWGINPGQFASISGSIGWPLLLAALFWVLGIHASIALAVNVLLSLGVILVAHRIVRRAWSNPWYVTASLLVFLLAVPLGSLVVGGMEHVVQILLSLLFAEAFLRYLAAPRQAEALWLIGLAAALSLVRYEGLLLVLAACLLLAAHRKLPIALAIGIAALLPVSVYGALSVWHGWYPVPNAVYFRRAELVPSTLREVPGVVLRSLDTLDSRPDLRAAVLLPVLALLWRTLSGMVRSLRDQDIAAVSLFLLTALVHLTVVGNSAPRYDAYLVVLSWWAAVTVLGPILAGGQGIAPIRSFPFVGVGAALAVILLFPLGYRGVEAMVQLPADTRTMYEQSYQVARLAAQECAGNAAAAESVGLPAYRGVRVLDLSGLGTMEAARARRAGGIPAALLETLAADQAVRLAVVHEGDLFGPLPSTWVKLGTWTIYDCPGCAEKRAGVSVGDSLTLYSTREKGLESLTQCLENFNSTLPASVVSALDR